LKKNILNTAIAVSILFAFLFLTNADLVHHHDDGTSHQRCQVCILISFAVTAVITSSLIKLSREEIYLRFIPLQDTSLVKNHFKLNYPDRAPPQNT
jgi:hypothetical protein